MKAFQIFFFLCLQQIGFATVYIVTNTNNAGVGSLRYAIQQANVNAGAHSIVFQIPLTDPGYIPSQGIFVIYPQSPLPYLINSNITIDATTQTNFTGNTNAQGPEIVLDGNHTIDFAFFVMNVSGITIKGFNIKKFIYGIQISGSQARDCVISGNYIGVNHTGTDTAGCYIGIEVFASAHHNTIGGTDIVDRNIISGNYHIGLRLLNSSFNKVYNNYIGTDKNGTYALPNYDGLSIEAISQYNEIGGNQASMRNLISGNIAYGLPLIGIDTRYNTIKGNYIGTNASGTSAIPNTYGILFDDGSRYNIVGGYNSGEGNLISGNSAYGLFIYNNGTMYNDVFGNLIGTNADGNSAVPNGIGIVIDGKATSHRIDKNVISGNSQQGIAIHITGSNYHKITRNLIGTDITGNIPLGNQSDGIRIAEGGQYNIIGIAPDSGNIIAFNGGNGITLMTAADFGNTISGNSFYQNAFIGIDLYPQGVTLNDPEDLDDGPNMLLNYPYIDSAVINSSNNQTTIYGHIHHNNPELCKVEIYMSSDNAAGYGEGMLYLGSVTPSVTGMFSLTISQLLPRNKICALTIDNIGNTSEFSANFVLPNPHSIQEKTLSEFLIYPNPVNDYLHIESTFVYSVYSFILYDLYGNNVLEQNNLSGCSLINTSELETGIYFMYFYKNNSLKEIKKLLIIR